MIRPGAQRKLEIILGRSFAPALRQIQSVYLLFFKTVTLSHMLRRDKLQAGEVHFDLIESGNDCVKGTRLL